MAETYFPPTYQKSSFHCAHCGVFAAQTWTFVLIGRISRPGPSYSDAFLPDNFGSSNCAHCGRFSLWMDKSLLYPDRGSAPMPHTDMPASVAAEYREAAAIISRSPRGAAALLRLAVQKLCIELGKPGKNLDHDIGALVKEGLRVEIQKALDVLRVIGNNAVHPLELNLKDDFETCGAMFTLLNMIVEDRISQPKKVQELFNSLPGGNLDAIKKRDSGTGK